MDQQQNYGLDPQTQAFNDGIAEQQRMGREAYEANQKALDEMAKHRDLIARMMSGNLTEDEMNDPTVAAVMQRRVGALGSALRSIAKR
jgi:trans-2-enoyl-CoA reductase